jgi:hypothetical protein
MYIHARWSFFIFNFMFSNKYSMHVGSLPLHVCTYVYIYRKKTSKNKFQFMYICICMYIYICTYMHVGLFFIFNFMFSNKYSMHLSKK